MPFVPLKQKRDITVNSYSDLIDEITSFLVTTCGWTLHDDMRAEATPYVVLTTTGEDGLYYPLYLRIFDKSVSQPSYNYFYFEQYTYWDNTTHTGRNLRAYTTQTSSSTNTYGGMRFLFSGQSTVGFLGNKNFFSIACAESASYRSSCFVSAIKPITLQNALVSQAAAAGVGVDVYFDAVNTPIDKTFMFGGNYFALNEIGQFAYVEVSNMDYINNKITVVSLARDMGVGSYIGPMPYNWVIMYNEYKDGYNTSMFKDSVYTYSKFDLFDGSPDKYTLDSTNYTTEGEDCAIINACSFSTSNDNYIDHGGTTRLITPVVAQGIDYPGLMGQIEHLYYYGVALDPFDTIGHGRLDSGMATSATTNTITVSGKTWTTDEFAGKAIVITNGQNVGDVKIIQSNTADTITIAENWKSTLDATSEYVVYDNVFYSLGYNTGYSGTYYRYIARIT